MAFACSCRGGKHEATTGMVQNRYIVRTNPLHRTNIKRIYSAAELRLPADLAADLCAVPAVLHLWASAPARHGWTLVGALSVDRVEPRESREA